MSARAWPWPSSRWLETDDRALTGVRLRVDEARMPVDREGRSVDPASFFEGWDGFCPTSPILARLEHDARGAPFSRPEESLTVASPTVLVDVERNQRVAHHVEPTAVASLVRVVPAARLRERATYAFGARSPEMHADPGARLALARAGVALSGITDVRLFRTGSAEPFRAELLRARDDALADMARRSARPSIRGVTDLPGGARIVRGVFEGRDVLAGTPRLAPFTAFVPRSLRDRVHCGGARGGVVVYGHGLFGSREEILRDAPRALAERLQAVFVAVDLAGLAEADAEVFVDALLDLSRLRDVVARARQGLVDTLLLPRALAGGTELAAFQESGRAVFDPSDLAYYGVGQGAVFGVALAALDPDIDRFALGAGGIGYPLMMPGSVHWNAFEAALSGAYADPAERELLLAMSAHVWERVEGAAFAPHVMRERLRGACEKRVLLQIALHDAQVPNASSALAARTLGLPPGAMRVHDLGAPAPPEEGGPPARDNGAHEALRRDRDARRELVDFLGRRGRAGETSPAAIVCSPAPNDREERCAGSWSSWGCGATTGWRR